MLLDFFFIIYFFPPSQKCNGNFAQERLVIFYSELREKQKYWSFKLLYKMMSTHTITADTLNCVSHSAFCRENTLQGIFKFLIKFSTNLFMELATLFVESK